MPTSAIIVGMARTSTLFIMLLATPALAAPERTIVRTTLPCAPACTAHEAACAAQDFGALGTIKFEDEEPKKCTNVVTPCPSPPKVTVEAFDGRWYFDGSA